MGTTKTSGWAVFLFLTGFMVLGTVAVGSGLAGLSSGLVILAVSGAMFRVARKKEGV